MVGGVERVGGGGGEGIGTHTHLQRMVIIKACFP